MFLNKFNVYIKNKPITYTVSCYTAYIVVNQQYTMYILYSVYSYCTDIIVKMCHEIMYAWPNTPACVGVELLKRRKNCT
jgi:hypothetical protein